MGDLRMLVDGELVEAEGGVTFDNVNPATEEVLGPVADGSAADMGRAVTAARRAFDTTAWSTDRELRKACLDQIQRRTEGLGLFHPAFGKDQLDRGCQCIAVERMIIHDHDRLHRTRRARLGNVFH